LQHYLKMHLATIALIAGKVLSVAVIILAAIFIDHQTIGFYIMVAAGIVGHGLMLLFAWFYASKFIKVTFAFDKDYCLHLIKKAWPYGLALILSTIYFKIDVTLLSLMRSQEEVGFYGVPLRMVEVLIVLPLFFMNSVIGTMTKVVNSSKYEVDSYKGLSKSKSLQGQKSGKDIQKIFALSFQFLLTAAIPIFIFVYFFGREIIRLISSESFLSTPSSYGSDSVLILLIIALCISFFSTLCSFTMVAFNQQKRVLWVNAAGALFNLFTNLYFIPLYGFMGAAYTSIASEILISFIAAYFLLKTFRFSFPWKIIFKTLLSGILVFFALKYLLPFLEPLHALLQMFIAGIFMSGLYLGVLYFTRVIDFKKNVLI
ncbi:oligosaccharide flippase family protein, partial [Candidatus Peregrinibacteria bacterium]|nr:oligosaccharide flippase family protein [Candidatus Peregrinibacteria bacterium]